MFLFGKTKVNVESTTKKRKDGLKKKTKSQEPATKTLFERPTTTKVSQFLGRRISLLILVFNECYLKEMEPKGD